MVEVALTGCCIELCSVVVVVVWEVGFSRTVVHADNATKTATVKVVNIIFFMNDYLSVVVVVVVFFSSMNGVEGTTLTAFRTITLEAIN